MTTEKQNNHTTASGDRIQVIRSAEDRRKVDQPEKIPGGIDRRKHDRRNPNNDPLVRRGMETLGLAMGPSYERHPSLTGDAVKVVPVEEGNQSSVATNTEAIATPDAELAVSQTQQSEEGVALTATDTSPTQPQRAMAPAPYVRDRPGLYTR